MRKVTIHLFMMLALLLMSCESMVPQPIFKLSLHQVVSDAERENGSNSLMVNARTIDGSQKRMLRGFPMIDSRHILKIDVLRQNDGVKAALKIYFDDFAPGIWSEVRSMGGRQEVAVVVDGFISGFMTLPVELDEGNSIVTPPIWSLAEARAIAENAKKNYIIINKR